MGGKKPVEKNREWEKGRRDKLNQKFTELSRLLPDHDPSISLSKMEILNRAAQYIKTLQIQNQDILNGGKDAYLDSEVDKLQQRVAHLVFKTKLLVDALRNAGVPIPEVKPPRKRKRPCKQTEPVEEIMTAIQMNTDSRNQIGEVEKLSHSQQDDLSPSNATFSQKHTDTSVKDPTCLLNPIKDSLSAIEESNEHNSKVGLSVISKDSVKISKEPLKEINSTLPSINIPKDISSVSQASQPVPLVNAAVKEQAVFTGSIPGVITSLGQNASIQNFSLFDRTSLVNLGPGTLILADGRVVNVPPPIPQIVVKPQPTLILMPKTVKKEKRLYPKQVDVTRTTFSNKTPIPAIKHFNFEFKTKRKIKVMKTRISPKQIKRTESVKSKIITKTNVVKINKKINQDKSKLNKQEQIDISTEQVINNESMDNSSLIQQITKSAELIVHKNNTVKEVSVEASTDKPNSCKSINQNHPVDSNVENLKETNFKCNVEIQDQVIFIGNDTDKATENLNDIELDVINDLNKCKNKQNPLGQVPDSGIEHSTLQDNPANDLLLHGIGCGDKSVGIASNSLKIDVNDQIISNETAMILSEESGKNTDDKSLSHQGPTLANEISFTHNKLLTKEADEINSQSKFNSETNETCSGNPDSFIQDDLFKNQNCLNRTSSSHIPACDKKSNKHFTENHSQNVSLVNDLLNDPNDFNSVCIETEGAQSVLASVNHRKDTVNQTNGSLFDSETNLNGCTDVVDTSNNPSCFCEEVNGDLQINKQPVSLNRDSLVNTVKDTLDNRGMIMHSSPIDSNSVVNQHKNSVATEMSNKELVCSNVCVGSNSVSNICRDYFNHNDNSSVQNRSEIKRIEVVNKGVMLPNQNKSPRSDQDSSKITKTDNEQCQRNSLNCPLQPSKQSNISSTESFMAQRSSINDHSTVQVRTLCKSTCTDGDKQIINQSVSAIKANSSLSKISVSNLPNQSGCSVGQTHIDKCPFTQQNRTARVDAIQPCCIGKDMDVQKKPPGKDMFYTNQNCLNSNSSSTYSTYLNQSMVHNQANSVSQCSYSNQCNTNYSFNQTSSLKSPYVNSRNNSLNKDSFPNQNSSLSKDSYNQSISLNKESYSNQSVSLNKDSYSNQNSSLNKDSYNQSVSLNKESYSNQSSSINEDSFSNQRNAVNKEYGNRNESLNKDSYSSQSVSLSKDSFTPNRSLNKDYSTRDESMSKTIFTDQNHSLINQASSYNKMFNDQNVNINKSCANQHSLQQQSSANLKNYVQQTESVSRSSYPNQNSTLCPGVKESYAIQNRPANKDYSNHKKSLQKEFVNQNSLLNKEPYALQSSSFTNKDYSNSAGSMTKDCANHSNSLNKDYDSQNSSLNKEYVNQSKSQSGSLNKEYVNQNKDSYSLQSSSFSNPVSLNKSSNHNSSFNKDYAGHSNSMCSDYVNRNSDLPDHSSSLTDDSYRVQNSSFNSNGPLNKNYPTTLNKDCSNQNALLNKDSYALQSNTFNSSSSLNKEYGNQNNSLNKEYGNQNNSLNKEYGNQNSSLNKESVQNNSLSKESYSNHSRPFNSTGTLNKNLFTNQESSTNSSCYGSQVSKEMYGHQNKESFSKTSGPVNKPSYGQSNVPAKKGCQPGVAVCGDMSSTEFMDVINSNLIISQHNKESEMSTLQIAAKEKPGAPGEHRNINCNVMFGNQAAFNNVNVSSGSVNIAQPNDNVSYEGNTQKRNLSVKDNVSYNKNNGTSIVCKYTIDSLFKKGDINSRGAIGSDSSKNNSDNSAPPPPCKSIMEKRNSAPYELEGLPMASATETNLNHSQNQLFQNESFSISARESRNVCSEIAMPSNRNIAMIQPDLNSCKNNGVNDKNDQNKPYNNSATIENNNYGKNDAILMSTTDLMKSKEMDRNNLMPLLDDVRLTTDFSSDLFSSFQVAPGGQHPESMSPTAAFLLAFPLVSTSKTADNIAENDNPEHNSSTPTTILQIGNIEPTNPDLYHGVSQVEGLRSSKPIESTKDYDRYTGYEQNIYESVPAQIDHLKRKSNQNFSEQPSNCAEKSFKRNCDVRKRSRNHSEPLPSYSQAYSYPIFTNNNDFSQFPSSNNIGDPKSNSDASSTAPWSMNLNQDYSANSTQTVVQKDVCTSTSTSKTTKERKNTKTDKQPMKNSSYPCSQHPSVDYYNFKPERKKQKTSHTNKTPVNWMAPLEPSKNTFMEPQLSQSEIYTTNKEQDTINIMANQSQNVVYNNIVSSLEVPFDSVCFSDFNGKKSNNYSWSPNKSLLPSLDNHNFVIPSTLPTLVGDLALGTSTPAETFKSFEDRRYEPPKKADKSSSTFLDNAVTSTSNANSKKRSDYNNKAVGSNNSFLSVSQLVDPKNQQKQNKINDINSRKRSDNSNKHQNITNRRDQEQNCIYNQRNDIANNCWNDRQQKNQYKGNHSAESLIGGVQVAPDAAETFHLNFNNYQSQNNYFHGDFTDGQLQQGQNYQNYFNPQSASHFPTFIGGDEFTPNIHDVTASGSQRKKKQKDTSVYPTSSVHSKSQDSSYVPLHKGNGTYLNTLSKDAPGYHSSGLLSQGYPNCIKTSVPYVSQHTNTTSTLTNFNLSTIFPEINDQRVAAGTNQSSQLHPNFSTLPLHNYPSH